MDENAPADSGRGIFYGHGPPRIPMGWDNRVMRICPFVSVETHSTGDGVHFPIGPSRSVIAVRASSEVRGSLRIR